MQDNILSKDYYLSIILYISGMTDKYAVEKYMNIFIPRPIANINTDDYVFELAKQNGLC